GSGGEHILFRHVTGLRNSASKVGPGIDVRGDGGYIIAPPSSHASGRRYTWSVDHHPLDTPIAGAPDWLKELAYRPAAGTQTPVAQPPENWLAALSGPCPEGRRNDTLARLVGHLLRRHVDPLVVLAIAANWNLLRCQPPLDDAELLRTIDSIAGK